MRSKKYWQIVSDGIPEPVVGTINTKVDGLKLKDLKPKNFLFQAINRSILETILYKDTFKQIWDFIKKKYQGLAKAKRQKL